ncbi:preprotein translocase subunit SecA [Adlercreutzia caecimuris]|jgi:preprotein translocase subunit SecA|uniref:Protein translocase subunit SecA n=2 Tax=Adlercreutzia caecimuris TaxID=671266 RepID=R9KYQ5_9ACTN|nr:preprotein translocase subunit SecA [Adlercreutzia caecimuris]EOS51418.1 preprotein translocase, SecA subunit [Adlercreutzia caecimuris B7]MCI9206941.1 preprotein translocase subunit SecA [Adlercreutzia caecimuris]MCR2036747.1 preprotein translocase subunit SecA [Adlercreutzia caecimuris]
MGFLSKLLTMGEGKQLKRYQAKVDKINALEPEFQALTDEQLAAKTSEFRERYAAGESLDDLLPEAFAAVREASVRTIGLRHFDVQLIGGMALNEGQIAEMKTGEGKTLVSTLAGYLNAIPGHNVHIVTVNDYLARRDCEWMGRIYRFLGMKTGLIQNGMAPAAKKPAYEADITYGTNSEFGFDYLRDNMVTRGASRVQRGHHFAIVDEVDSILIDEARTPLIISGAGTQAADTYKKFARVMPGLQKGVDFDMDEAKRTINATESGLEKIEAMLGIENIYADPSGQLANHLQQALKAQFLFHRDVDYVVMDGEVKIVDEFTGRIMEGRRYSEGLHQALEAKERVIVREENQTLATITLQNYFRLYDKLSGMTGTAMTEDAEFRQIYKLPVMAIPPNRPVIRKDENDLVYRTVDGKFNAVADDIAERHAAGQPCLIGTVSIENSEKLSRLLDKRGIPHETLNAKHHEREAHIVAQAGRAGAVTIATNMAGRGTDIRLGGDPEVLAEDMLRQRGFNPDAVPGDEEEAGRVPTAEDRAAALAEAEAICDEEQQRVRAAGGLCVIGTERHESRRIDNQLRGRSGRQGDPGVTQFYLSLEDDLMRLFGGSKMDSIAHMMEKTNQEDDMPIQASMVSKSIESAQRQVESMHFAARKNVLEYDDVMNLQRKAIYEERNAILDGKSMTDRIPGIIRDAVDAIVAECCPDRTASDDWDMKAIDLWAANMTGCNDFAVEKVDHEDDPEAVAEALYEFLDWIYEQKADQLGPDLMGNLSAQVMLRIIDTRWMAHLQEMDYLKTGIGLRAFGQRDPLVEYKNEAYNAFQSLTASMYDDYLRTLLRLEIAAKPAAGAGKGAPAASPLEDADDPLERKMSYSSPEEALASSGVRGRHAAANMPGQPPKPAPAKPQTFVKDKEDPYANVGRNDPCPCGSGKKFKKCHGQNL